MSILVAGRLSSCVPSRPYTSVFLIVLPGGSARPSTLLASLIAGVPADRHAYMSCGVSVPSARLAACLVTLSPHCPE